jgi:endonuclease/exonuclease/phosphatase family metal-dependent hydrolase
MALTFDVATVNTLHAIAPSRLRRYLAKRRRAAGRTDDLDFSALRAVDMGGAQETDQAVWHTAAAKALGWRIHSGHGPLAENTVFWGEEWTASERKVIPTHDGLAEVSPDRGITRVVLGGHGLRGALLCTHYVSAAWNRKRVKEKAWRKTAWNAHHAILTAEVRELLERDDLNFVIVVGDFNRPATEYDIPGLHFAGDQRIRRGIDHIWVSDGLHVESVRKGRKRASDHAPVIARLTTTKEAPVPPTPPKPTPTPTGPALITKIATAEVGYREGHSGGHWNNDQKYSKQLPGFEWSNYQAWCATFVCWCFWRAGLLKLIPTPSAGVDQLAAGFIKAGRWSEFPAVGGIVFFGVPSSSGQTVINGRRYDLNHTGYVTGYDPTYVFTREGNTNDSGSREGDGVYAKRHLRRSARIIGYGYPDYPGGIVSADPAWKRQQPKPDPIPVPPKPAPVKPAEERAAELVLDILEEKDVQRDDVEAYLRGAARALRADEIEPVKS